MNILELKAPDWRWQLAQACVTALLRNCMLPSPTDPLVPFVMRVIRAYKNPGSRIFLHLKYPLLMAIYKIGVLDIVNPMRCQLLAAILASLNDKQVLLRVLWHNLLQLRFYCDVFFDVGEWKRIPLWVLQHLVRPIQQRRYNKLFRSRVLALNLGYDAARLTYLWGKGSKKLSVYMQLLLNNLRVKNLFDYFIALHNIDLQTLAALVSGTLTKMDDRLFHRLMQALSASEDATIALLAHDLHKAIRTYTVLLQLGHNLTLQDDTNLVISTIIAQSTNKEQ